MTSRDTEIERPPQLTEASVAFLLEHRGYPGCTMASLTIRERLEVIERQARSQPASEPSLDVERLGRAIFAVEAYRNGSDWAFDDIDEAAQRAFVREAEPIAAEYARLSQPADRATSGESMRSASADRVAETHEAAE